MLVKARSLTAFGRARHGHSALRCSTRRVQREYQGHQRERGEQCEPSNPKCLHRGTTFPGADVLLRHRPRRIAARRLDRWMKVGPDTGSRPTDESHLNGGVPRSGLLPGPHASPGLGASAFAPLLTTLNPYDCTIPPGFSGSVDVGLSFSPEKTQIELACDVAATFGVGLPGGPITSPAKAALALAPASAAVQTAAASIDFLRIFVSFPLMRKMRIRPYAGLRRHEVGDLSPGEGRKQ